MNQGELENAIGYRFSDKNLLSAALTHPSCSVGKNYERLEFLGDAVLELCVSRYLFSEYPNVQEGELTKKRSAIVCSDALVRAARGINLGAHILLGKGEIATGGRDKNSILENVFEAVMGAVYLDGGLPVVQPIVEKLLIGAENGEAYDYKSHLQEIVQAKGNQEISYDTYCTEGPPHEAVFYVRLLIGGGEVSLGQGKSKKQAEQEAAKNALAILK